MLIQFIASFGVVLSFASLAAAEQIPLETEIIAINMGESLAVAFPPGDRERFFVPTKEGIIWIIKNDARLGTPFLDVGHLTVAGGERGLLGLAFHPDYAINGWLYINYTNLSGDTRVDRITVSSNPDIADINSRVNILSVSQPFSNHNGGCLQFGPDGFLYIGLGDGGAAGDPGNRAQNPQELLGKMLRLDVDHGLPYSIPSTNPFISDSNTLDEIWALGLRNPWRFSFDRETGELYIADVGQNEWEYVHHEPSGHPGGSNYGWRIIEGSHCYNPGSGCNTAGLEMPIYEYDHTISPFRCCIIGAEVFRGRSMANMQGRFFFTDSCSGELQSFRYSQVGGISDYTNHTSESGVDGAGKSLGSDFNGELYICVGQLLKRVVPSGMYLKVPHLFTGVVDTIEVLRCTPSSTVYLAYSLVGTGLFPVGQLGISVLLDAPALAGVTTSDSNGDASFPIVPPGFLFDRTVWLEAVQQGQVSNVTRETVE